MGSKRVIKVQASSRISKKDHPCKLHQKQEQRQHLHHLQEFDDLINDLKPKVYITDSSSFKQLVQDLTGNNNNNNGSPNSSSTFEVHDDDVQLLHQNHHQVPLMSSVEPLVSTEAPASTTTSLSEEFFSHNNNSNNNYMNYTPDELMVMMYKEDEEDNNLDGFICRSNNNNYNNNQMVVEISEGNDSVFEDILASDFEQINYLESLLFDDDDHHHHHQVFVEQPLITDDPFYSQMFQQPEISVYDYGFSGLIN
ncbi:hypothetical protein QN277_018633 [Acacia crassicarpa]|uniref:VQ domain-containing protein n=1 Tax=Acacia crassicarpa TaxID=499986 RepID=A0AAE1JQZ5_9FABA|nr:hypothetical protein QN277_018633 [Acacia crassicarpa]